MDIIGWFRFILLVNEPVMCQTMRRFDDQTDNYFVVDDDEGWLSIGLIPGCRFGTRTRLKMQVTVFCTEYSVA